MLKTKQILVRAATLAVGVASLSACGQPGALYLPTESPAAQRATLPQTLVPPNPFETAPTAPKPVTPVAPTPTSSPTAL